MTSTLVAVMAAAFAAGTVAAALWPSGAGARRWSLAAAFVGCLAGLAAAIRVLVAHTAWTYESARPWRMVGGLSLSLDPLGAFFLVVVAFTGLSASIYGAGYLRDLDRGRRGRLVHAMFNAFLAGMCLVTAAGNAITFLFGWELMAVASYVLVVSGSAEDDAPAAGLWYAVMTHAGFAALLAAFLLLGHGSLLSFAGLRAQGAVISPRAASAIFVLALFAFGSKAGMAPLHVWLPRAHPAAPSHVSALMSAAMVKLGIYGLIRLLFDLLPIGPAWWGGVVLAAGVGTALTGVLYSVIETHIKRVLAYSTIENVGLILTGLGFALLMRSVGYPALAAAGLVVCLLHTLNHAAFKSLLFLGAGAVVHSTHRTSLEAYGGLIKRMPRTAAWCFVGVLALAALPPLNGFPSEWLTFQLLVAGSRHTVPELAILLPVALGGVALAAGLAAVSAVRLFGITFLALPRTDAAATADDAGGLMQLAMAIPAVACLALGVAPAAVLPWIATLAGTWHLPAAPFAAGAVLSLPLAGGHLWPIALAGVLLGAAAIAALAVRFSPGAGLVRSGPAWNCGRVIHSPRAEYTAAAFAEPLKRVFTGFYRPSQEVTVTVHGGSRYFVRSVSVQGGLTPWIEQALYAPLVRATTRVSRAVRRLQAGSIHWYLALIPIALLALLLSSRWIR